MPSRCSTAACAARHDQIVERVLVFAQSIDLGEVLPERLLGKRRGDRLGAGDDQSVDLQAIEIGDIGVLLCRHRHFAVCERVTDGSEKQWKSDAAVAGGRLQQTHELPLGRLQRAHPACC